MAYTEHLAGFKIVCCFVCIDPLISSFLLLLLFVGCVKKNGCKKLVYYMCIHVYIVYRIYDNNAPKTTSTHTQKTGGQGISHTVIYITERRMHTIHTTYRNIRTCSSFLECYQ